MAPKLPQAQHKMPQTGDREGQRIEQHRSSSVRELQSPAEDDRSPHSGLHDWVRYERR